MTVPPLSPPSGPGARRRNAAAIIAGLALTVFLLIPERTLVDGYDWAHLHVFYKEFYRTALLQGSLPHWNPFIALGRPLLADVELAVFYPPNLLYLAGVMPGMVLNLWLHFTLVLLGMLRLTRRLSCRELAGWFAALGFALSAPLLARLQSGQIQVFCSLCWLPWVFATADEVVTTPGGRAAARFALATGLLFLAGSPPIFWIAAWTTGLGLGLRAAFARVPAGTGRGFAWLLLGAVLAGGLVAVQSLPFLELVAQGNRHGQDAYYALGNNRPVQVAWSVLVARLPGGFFYWEYNLFSGTLVFLLGAAGFWLRRTPLVFALGLLAGFFLLLALGGATPLLPALVAHVPGWASFRIPSRYGIVTAFALCLLAAHALEQIARWCEQRRPGAAGTRLAYGVVGTLLVLNVADAGHAQLARGALYTEPPTDIREDELVNVLRASGRLAPGLPPPRVLGPPWLVREDSGLRHGYTTLSGFANPFLTRVWDHLHAAAAVSPSVLDPVNLPIRLYSTPLVAFPDIDLAARWEPVTERFVLTGPQPARFRLEPEIAGDRVALQAYRNDRLAFETEAAGTRQLVVAEPWYPGWRATIDGQPAEVVVAHDWMRAVTVPGGRHIVELVFRSRWLALGGCISALSLGLLTALWWRSKPESPRSAP